MSTPGVHVTGTLNSHEYEFIKEIDERVFCFQINPLEGKVFHY